MKTIYIKQDGIKINTQVNDEFYEEIKLLRREEWRNDFNFKSKFYSLDGMMEQGLDIPDDSLNPENVFISQEDEGQKSLQYKKLKQAFTTLTKKQKHSIHNHFFLEMSYSEIASDNSVSKQAIEQSIHGALKKLRKVF